MEGWLVPPVVAALVAAGVASFWANVIVQLGIALIGTVVSYGISKLATVIGGKPKSQDFQFDAENRKQMIRSSITSRKIVYGKCRISGPLVYVASSDNNGIKNRILHMVVALASHEIEAIDSVYFDDLELTLNGDGYATNTKYTEDGVPGYVRVMKHLGSPTQVANSVMTAEAPNWTSNHRLQGIAYLYVRLVFRQDMFQTIPNISCVIRGKKVYDPRTLATAYSNNAALCVLDYLRDPRFGIKSGDEFIDFDSFSSAANACDELVILKDLTTTKRYKVDGQIDCATDVLVNIEKMTSAFGGACTYIGGEWKACPGVYTSPIATIDETWLAGELQVSAKPSRSELFNAVKGVYVDPTKGWQPTTFPLVTNSLYESEDGGKQIIKDIDLPFTIDVQDAQRIGKLTLEKGRQGIIVTMPCNLRALQVVPWDNVYINNEILGWSSKIFKIIDWELNTEAGVTLTLQEESSASYDWNQGEATLFDPAPDTNLPGASIEPPGVPQVFEELYSSNKSAGIKAKAVLTWAASPSAFVSRYELQYKESSATTWVSNGQSIEPSASVFDLAAGLYNFRVKAISFNGRESTWVEKTALMEGLTAPPANVQNFTLNAINNQAHLSWTTATDLDVLSGGSYHIRWCGNTAAPSWSESIALAENIPGSATTSVQPLLDGVYLIRAVDSTGNASITASQVLSVNSSVFTMNTVATLTENPAFTGTKTNMSATAGVLSLSSGLLFDSASGNFDSASGNFDTIGTLSNTGAYQFSNYIDLGSVYTSRVTASIQALTYLIGFLFDSTGGLFDDVLGMFEGADVTGVDVTWYVRTTQDDPAGSPVWSSWNRFFVGEYTARAYQFKIEVVSDDNTKNINITQLSVTVDVPDKIQLFRDQSIASGGTTFTYSEPFFAMPSVGATVTNTLSGDSVKVTHILTGVKYTGATVQILNGGSGVARTATIMANGY